MGKECTWNLQATKEHVWKLQVGRDTKMSVNVYSGHF